MTNSPAAKSYAGSVGGLAELAEMPDLTYRRAEFLKQAQADITTAPVKRQGCGRASRQGRSSEKKIRRCRPMVKLEPCKDCPERHPVCHDSCPKYAEYKRQLKAQRIYTSAHHAAEHQP